MENGTYKYDLEMSTPLGKRRGSLELMVWGNYLNGTLTMFGRTIPIRDGSRNGKQVSFQGDMKTLMKMLPYQAEGMALSSGIELTVKTEQGIYPVSGMLAEKRRS